MPERRITAAPGSSDALLAWLGLRVAAAAPRGAAGHAGARRFFDVLGGPQDTRPAVHVVGTAGKGSVAGLLTGRLAAAGVGVVTHMSPHVRDIRERFLVHGELPDWSDVLAVAPAVVDAAEELERETGSGPSFFAVTAALAWELGRRHGTELAVIEAGIGGRHDATNVMTRPDVLTVITAIGLDHTDVLGETVEAIAAEKAAVLTGRTEAVLGPQPHPGAVAVVESAAEAAGCRLHLVDPAADWRDAAVATVETVTPILEQRLAQPIPAIAVPLPQGRFEVDRLGGRRVILDGAHNPMKLGALASSLTHRPRAGEGSPCVIAALGAGKDLAGCAAALAEIGGVIVATEFGAEDQPGPRSWPASALAQALASHERPVVVAPTPGAAAAAALRLTTEGDTVVVTGSFLHLAAVRDELGRLSPLSRG